MFCGKQSWNISNGSGRASQYVRVAAELSSWVGTCPGKQESVEENRSSRSAKGNKYLRRVLNQAAHAAVNQKGSYFQALFPASVASVGLSVRYLGHRPSALPRGLDDLT
jgi:transposase